MCGGWGCDALHLACQNGRSDASSALLSARADPLKKSTDPKVTLCDAGAGGGAMDIAQAHGHEAIIEILRAHRAEPTPATISSLCRIGAS